MLRDMDLQWGDYTGGPQAITTILQDRNQSAKVREDMRIGQRGMSFEDEGRSQKPRNADGL